MLSIKRTFSYVVIMILNCKNVYRDSNLPDKIHYAIEICEYFEEKVDDKSQPEEYRMKEVGDYWHKQGQVFLVTKTFDITLEDFNQIDGFLKRIDSKDIHTMCIGERENKDMLSYYQKEGNSSFEGSA